MPMILFNPSKHFYCHFLSGKLGLDEDGNLERKENVVVANEEFATENKTILTLSNKLADYFMDESL